MINAMVVGADGGLGSLVADKLDDIGFIVQRLTVDSEYNPTFDPSELIQSELAGELDVLVQCQGSNELDWIENVGLGQWDRLMNANALSLLRTVQWCLPALIRGERPGTVCNIISNASDVPLTGSIAYNASKGAAKIMTLQMARELGRRHNITVFGISPNKLEGTPMSETIEARVLDMRGWTAEEAKAYQLAALPAGEETNPDQLAQFIGYLLEEEYRHKYLAGTILPYGGPTA